MTIQFGLKEIYWPGRYHPWKKLGAGGKSTKELENIIVSCKASSLALSIPCLQPPAHLVWDHLPHSLPGCWNPASSLQGCWAASSSGVKPNRRGVGVPSVPHRGTPLHGLTQMALLGYELELSSSSTWKVGQGHGGAPQETGVWAQASWLLPYQKKYFRSDLQDSAGAWLSPQGTHCKTWSQCGGSWQFFKVISCPGHDEKAFERGLWKSKSQSIQHRIEAWVVHSWNSPATPSVS